ncbi:MAG: GNAT family N-acetyltransferase [Capsulimonadaceae bacterium]
MIEIRRVTPEDGPLLKRLRCASLADSPDAVRSVMQREMATTDSEWAERAAQHSSGDLSVMYFGVVDGVECALGGCYRSGEDLQGATMFAVWVAPAYRKRGAGRALLDYGIDWARRHSCIRLFAWVNDANTGARRLYTAAGFRDTGRRVEIARDATSLAVRPMGDDMLLKLDLSRPAAEPAEVVVISVAVVEDASEILALQKLAFDDEAVLYNDRDLPPLKEALSEMEYTIAHQTVLKAECDNIIVGAVRGRMDRGTCHVGRLVVHPSYRRQGIGSRLMGQIERRFPDAVRYEIFTGHRSDSPLRLYPRLGYRRWREEFVSDELTLVYLEKPGRLNNPVNM